MSNENFSPVPEGAGGSPEHPRVIVPEVKVVSGPEKDEPKVIVTSHSEPSDEPKVIVTSHSEPSDEPKVIVTSHSSGPDVKVISHEKE